MGVLGEEGAEIMEWIDAKNPDKSIYGSLLMGSTGVLCRIHKRERSEWAEDWDGTWFGVVNVSHKCPTPPVYENKDLDKLKQDCEEHLRIHHVI